LLSFGAPAILVSAFPALAAVSGAIRSVVLSAAIVGTIALIGRELPRRWMLVAMGFLLAFALLPGDVRTSGEFVLSYSIALLTIAGAAAVCLWFARDNYLAYAILLWVVALRGPLADLYGNARPAHFWAVVAILIAGILWALLPASHVKPRPS
jgi:hypothetical protein